NLAGAIPVIATFIVILLTFLLGLIIYHYFILAVPAGLFDRKHFFAALIHSYRLIKGEFWKTLGIRCIFYGGIIMLQYSLMSLPGGLIGILIAFTSDNPILLVSISSTAWLLYYGISIITGVIASSFINILTSVIFFNQKMKKEGLHIAMILERLESTLHGF
ncbi:MAG: hypothetical protein LBQ68_02270, partial [Clostridiales bacterium]|nr:hypothetical protein [Clostridiales bacterium]